MNSKLILFHLHEAKEELDGIIKSFQENSEHSEGSLSVEMQHLYHHLNTAWNSRNSLENEDETDGIFQKRRQFPSDITM